MRNRLEKRQQTFSMVAEEVEGLSCKDISKMISRTLDQIDNLQDRESALRRLHSLQFKVEMEGKK